MACLPISPLDTESAHRPGNQHSFSLSPERDCAPGWLARHRLPVGPDLHELADSVRTFFEAGFTDVVLVQIGGASQHEFLVKAAEPLLDKLQAL